MHMTQSMLHLPVRMVRGFTEESIDLTNRREVAKQRMTLAAQRPRITYELVCKCRLTSQAQGD